MNNLEEFAQQFKQDILSESEVAGVFNADVFFEKYCDYLTSAGEIHSADRAYYQGPSGSGIRVDGYGGDPAENDDGQLSLIICDFHLEDDAGRLTESQMNVIFRRLSKFLRNALNPMWRNDLEETGPGFGLAELIAKRWGQIDRVRLFLISNRVLSTRVDRREEEELDGRTVAYNVWDIQRLYRFATIGRGQESVNIDIEDDFGGALPVLSARQSDAEHESWLAAVPGKMLADIYDRWGTRLLEQNVRVFLQARGNVNRGIRNTILHEPTMFFAYNNGITATAEEVTIKTADGGMYLHRLKNFQIVNGGQTTASIHRASRENADLSQLYVQMKLSVINPERSEDIVPKISEFANSQNRVTAADFFANHPFHVRIEGFSRRIHAPSPDGSFRQSRWFYERARGQYADARSKLTPAERKKFDLENPRSQMFTKTDLAKYLSVWDGQPHRVSLGAQKNFAAFAEETGKAWEKSPDDFNENWYRDAVAKAVIFKATEKIVSGQTWYSGGYRANIVAYAISKLANDVEESGRAVDFREVWQKKTPNYVLQKALAEVAREVNDVLTDPPKGISNVTEYAKKPGCWARVKDLNIIWPEGLWSELIMAEEKQALERGARKDQKLLNGVELQTAVVKAGAEFWDEALKWGVAQRYLKPKEISAMRICSQLPNKIPTENQCKIVSEALARLQTEGFQGSLQAER